MENAILRTLTRLGSVTSGQSPLIEKDMARLGLHDVSTYLVSQELLSHRDMQIVKEIASGRFTEGFRQFASLPTPDDFEDLFRAPGGIYERDHDLPPPDQRRGDENEDFIEGLIEKVFHQPAPPETVATSAFAKEERKEDGTGPVQELMREISVRTIQSELPLVSRYRFFQKIEDAAYESIYLALDLERDQLVRARVAVTPKSKEYRLRQERAILLLMEIVNDHLIEIIDFHQDDELTITIESYHSGGTLEHLVRGMGSLNEQVTLEFAHQIVEGLACAHQASLLHGDLNPRQIQIEPMAFIPKISGFSRRSFRSLIDGFNGQSAQLRWESEFAAPEIYSSDKTARMASDFYSLGAIMYFCLTGNPPVSRVGGRGNVDSPDFRIAPLASVCEHISDRTCQLIDQLLDKDMTRRPSNYQDLMAMIQDCLDSSLDVLSETRKLKTPKRHDQERFSVPTH